MKKKIDIGRLMGSIVFFMGVLGSFILSVKLILQERYYPAMGWAIILLILVFFTFLYHLPPKTLRKKRIRRTRTINYPKGKQAKDGEDLALLFSTKDHIKIERLKNALRENGIECTVLNQHSSGMMSFLPDVEMRMMVPFKNLESSLRIVEDLTKQNGE